MRRGFWGFVYSSFKKIHNSVVGVGGILIAVVLYLFAYPDNTGPRIAVSTAVIVATVLLVLLLTFADAAYELYKQGPNVSPKIRAGMQPFTGTSAALACVTDPSEWFAFGIQVTFYRVTEQGVEIPIGMGAVVNVQRDGKILMEMTRINREHEDFAQKLRENNADALAATRVMPYVTQQLFGPNEEQG
jgi:hypothetical protein